LAEIRKAGVEKLLALAVAGFVFEALLMFFGPRDPNPTAMGYGPLARFSGWAQSWSRFQYTIQQWPWSLLLLAWFISGIVWAKENRIRYISALLAGVALFLNFALILRNL
jgi:hypothetical protein